jgi:outer membrane protein, multidrug efflux system
MKHSLLTAALLPLIVTQSPAADLYQRPEVELPTQWKHGSGNSGRNLPDEWWKLFGSSTLNELVASAHHANQEIGAAQARVDQARALVGVRRSEWFPQLMASPGLSTSRLSQSAFGANIPPQFGALDDLLARDNYKASLDVSYEVDLWGRVRRSVESAEAKAKASTEAVSAQRLIVAAEVCRSFFLLRSFDWQVQILKDTLAVRDEALRLQLEKVKGGLSSDIEVKRAKTESELAKADLASFQGQRGRVENALAVLCGKPSGSFRVAISTQVPKSPAVPLGMPSDLLSSRPDIRAAEQQMVAAHADTRAAKAAFWPSMKITGSAGMETIDASQIAEWENRTYSLGISLQIPLFSGGRLKSNLNGAKAVKAQALADYRQTLLTALREVEDALLDLKSLNAQLSAIRSAQEAADETVKLTKVRQEKGLASYFEVVEADRTSLGTQLKLAQLEGQRAVSTVLLIQALGGSWMESGK